jgi:hypothetical protein
LPGLLGEQRPQAASRRGRSSSRSRRAGGRSTIANLGAAASPASTDAAGGACRPRDASRPPSRAVRPPRMSSPPDRPRTAGRPSSGSARARSDLHGRGVGGRRPCAPLWGFELFCNVAARSSVHVWGLFVAVESPEASARGFRAFPTSSDALPVPCCIAAGMPGETADGRWRRSLTSGRRRK